MQIKKIKIGNKEVMPFTIPSGIITTESSCLERIANEIPEVGILTTKSIGPVSRKVPEGNEVINRDPNKQYGNREPILAGYYPGCFMNAVGLTNPGADEFTKKISSIKIPKDKFLLASVFGGNIDEFNYVVEKLENLVDGFELNLSCPHVKGHGMQLGQDPKIVYDIIKSVFRTTTKPIFAKLTPNAQNIGDIAESAVKAGAYGLVAINTVGPGYYSIDGDPVLTNKVGGISGRGILPLGIKCVREIKEKVGDILIIGMGGIATASDVEAYASAGATGFGIGSALAGMKEKKIKNYFSNLVKDLKNGTNNAENLLKKVYMDYKKFKIVDKTPAGCDFNLFKFDNSIEASPGQFVFAWIPGIGEKPFSIMDDDPLTLGILERGFFTQKINTLGKGNYVYIRGPYGKKIADELVDGKRVCLVGGGCGIAGLYLLAKKFKTGNEIKILLGAKDKEHIPYLNEFKKYGSVFIATEDGSLGTKGKVSDLKSEFDNIDLFFNCGPRAMVEAVLPLESKINGLENIYSSIDYMTRCGIGICGSCANEKGYRTCVEGPFMNAL